MDSIRFQEAQQAYAAEDFRTAAKAFLASAGRGPEGNGVAYHMAGNALMRLRRYQDAVTVYGHALRDDIYDRRGAVWSNLGAAYSELGEYAEAAKAYESALGEADYTTPYKAYQGMAGALLERGRVEDAAIAYRKAALDPGNPDPGKALVNLGLCFMGLGRPADAVEAYRAALGFDQYEGRGKALANMGQAYVALEQYEDAVRSFEKAVELHGHELSPAAHASYETALAHVQPAPEQQAELPASEGEQQQGGLAAAGLADALPDAFDRDLASELAPEPATTAFTDFGAEFPEAGVGVTQPLAPFDRADRSGELGFGDEEAVADFFSVTEDQLKERDRVARRAARHERGPFAMWRTVVIAVVCVALVVAAAVAAYQMGYGWPTQGQAVGGMLSAYQSGGPVDGYWVAAPSNDVAKEMAKIPPMRGFTIDGVQRGPQVSKVSVTVNPTTGAALHYTITLAREGVGWKVSAVDNDWSTTGG